MLIPLLFRANLLSLTAASWLIIAAAISLTACGGGDPEPEPEAACLDTHATEPVRVGTGRHAHDVKVPAPVCREGAL